MKLLSVDAWLRRQPGTPGYREPRVSRRPKRSRVARLWTPHGWLNVPLDDDGEWPLLIRRGRFEYRHGWNEDMTPGPIITRAGRDVLEYPARMDRLDAAQRRSV